ncbi:MAG: endonuclease III domain-containing protein [Desulfovibrionaceae bacterium]|nr:endonuclease III domain-containing protein [Desulfovibrionaceae bacterium]MBF0513083.1 endonuclease III domain-containing protein [Desulfovibrionaceae bacterium]
MKRGPLLMRMFEAMSGALGPSGWWPAKTPFETAVGAVLAQNTNWGNAAKAMGNIERAGVMDCAALLALTPEALAELIRPAGYFRLKAARLRALLEFVDAACGGDPAALAAWPLETARERLLTVRGVGPETADSILLYAAGLPSFVIDAYTRRILSRHGLAPADAPYDELRDFFMDALPPDAPLYNEMHALIVRVGSAYCKTKSPACRECPLETFGDIHL